MLWPRFSGVIVVEATKQIYAATPLPAARKVASRVRAIAPLPAPTPARAVMPMDDE
jgi:hypothetical protein